MSKKIDFMLTAFRDGFQSVYGARVLTKDFLPAVEAARDAGISHFEAGGGARFQSLYFYCNEDAFDMMDQFRQVAGPDANLQTLARGINVVGLDSQSRDIIDLHARMFKKHGITTIRNFDALNDVNNLIYSGQCIHNAGLKHEVSITMMELPPGCTGAHEPEFYIDSLKKIMDADIPFDSVCFKDASGTSRPTKVYDTIKAARKLLGEKTKIVFHSHETAGTCILSYKAAIEAGASSLDLSMAPVSGGTCQPDIITMWHALRGSEFTLDIDINKIIKAEEVFKECMKDYFIPPEAKAVEPLIPFSPMPGGALTANTQMLRDNNLMNKYSDISAAMGEVVRKGGFGTSVTPVSQFYFQQAFNNVMFGPWTKIAEGYGKMVLGYFGKTPTQPDAEVIALAKEQLKLDPTTKSPLDINDEDPQKGIAAAKSMLKAKGLEESDENIFIAAACKEKGIAYLEGNGTLWLYKVDSQQDSDSDAYTVTVAGETFSVELDGDYAIVNGESYPVEIKAGISDSSHVKQSNSSGTVHDIEAPMAGLVLRIDAAEGERVSKGDVILVMEAMKMEQPITASIDGTINKIAVKQGDQIRAGQLLVELS